jgi:hypothetical protein
MYVNSQENEGWRTVLHHFHEVQDEIVRNKGASDENNSYLSTNADRNKNSMSFCTITMDVDIYVDISP